MEIRVKMEAPEIAEAIKYLADAIAGKVSGVGAVGQAAMPSAPAAMPAQVPAFVAPTYVTPQTVSAPIAMPAQQVSPIPQVSPAPQFTGVPVVTAPMQSAAVPVAMAAYTLEQLSVAATTLMDAGKMAALKELLLKYGVQAMTLLKPEAYGAFATDLRALGAKI